MKNILPKVSERITEVEKSKLAYWNANDADPSKAKISNCLTSVFTIDVESLIKYRENTLPQKEPNYLSPYVLANVGPSPLDKVARGVPDDIVIDARNAKFEGELPKSSYRKPKSAEPLQSRLVISVQSIMPINQDLFLQTQSSITTKVMQPHSEFVRYCILLCQLYRRLYPNPLRCLEGSTNMKSLQPHDIFHILSSTYSRATVTTTNRQEIKDYQFHTDSRIGLEIEGMNGRLICSKVIPNTQAAAFEMYLDGAELISVNGNRVMDLDEFQRAMANAKLERIITLKIASFKEGKKKIDNLFLHNFDKSQKVKSLLSNLIAKDDPYKNKSKFGSIASDYSDEEDEGDDEESKLSASVASEKKNDNPKAADVRQEASRLSTDKSRAEEKDHHESSYESEEFLPLDSDGEMGLKASKRVVTRDVQYGGLDVHEPIPEVQERIPEVSDPSQSVHLDEQSFSSQDSDTSWNHMTKLEQSVLPFTSLVCMPPQLRASDCWGTSRKYIQFSNYSRAWKFEINWVDEDGVLIPRTFVDFGKTHFEYCSVEHVWALIASPVKPKSRDGSSSSSSTSADVPIMLIIRPSHAALIEGKSTCLLWTPWSSVSVSQRMYSKSSQKMYEVKEEDSKIQPCINVQLLESKIRESDVANLLSDPKMVDEESAVQLIRKPLKTSRPMPTNNLQKSQKLTGRHKD